MGVSTLELDIVLTRDGQPLVWHDPTIQAEKCADTAPAFAGDPQYPYVGKLVHELTLAQLSTLDCGKRLDEFPNAEVVRGNKIATLPQVFSLADSYRADAMRYNIETKVDADRPGSSAAPQEFVDVILAAVRSAGRSTAWRSRASTGAPCRWRGAPNRRFRWWPCTTSRPGPRTRPGWPAKIPRSSATPDRRADGGRRHRLSGLSAGHR